jgi:pyruvate formate lyase activating enzyme
VFLKGCPLRCSWCHNPEGLSPRVELMISPNGCTHCGNCVKACPKGERLFDFGKPADCDACGLCVAACPQRIRRLAGEAITAEALAARHQKDAPYYAKTGGGVTFSGGEPLMQAAFVLETLRLLGPAVHKAVETSGYGPEADFAKFMGAFDLIMMDLKSMDDDIHLSFTGVSNRRIIANAKQLCAGSTPFIIRIPVIPGVNDTATHYRAVAELVAGAPALLRVELLPYHLTAGAKYAMLRKAYTPRFDPDRPIEIRTDIFAHYGIRSCVL